MTKDSCSSLRTVQAPDKLNVGVEARLQRIAICSCLPELVCIVSQQTTQVVVEAFDKVLCFGRSKALVVCRQKRRQRVAGLCWSLHIWSGSQKECDPSEAGLDQSHERKPTWQPLSTEGGPKLTAAEMQPCLTSIRRTALRAYLQSWQSPLRIRPGQLRHAVNAMFRSPSQRVYIII